jgi:hypothetical protein
VLQAPQATEVTLKATGSGNLSFAPATLTLEPGLATTVLAFGEAESASEGDTRIEIHGPSGVLGSAAVTVVRGIKLAFGGTFGFATDNANGYTASLEGVPFAACGGVEDPLVWRTTPLPCEGLTQAFNKLFFEDSKSLTRWSSRSGKRPRIEVAVTKIETFGPRIDLAGRDPRINVGTAIGSTADKGVAMLVTDDCDGPATSGLNEGAEQVVYVDLRVAEVFSLRYGGGPTRIWTHFPSAATEEERAADTAAISDLLPGGEQGCSSPGLTYFDTRKVLQCDASQSLRQLFSRNVGFRSRVSRAWANWTARNLTLEQGASFGASFVAQLFGQGAVDRTEAFMQLSGYDWYTLIGRIDKGMIGTAGAIPDRFEAHLASDGCPDPYQPDEQQGDDPFGTASR